jgi:hypothetical protein
VPDCRHAAGRRLGLSLIDRLPQPQLLDPLAFQMDAWQLGYNIRRIGSATELLAAPGRYATLAQEGRELTLSSRAL